MSNPFDAITESASHDALMAATRWPRPTAEDGLKRAVAARNAGHALAVFR